MSAVATIGFFDGVHRGHQFLFAELNRHAVELDCKPLIITFLQHPQQVINHHCPLLLTTLNEREHLLDQYGDAHFLDFQAVQPLTAADFLDYLADRWRVKYLIMGYNHCFGSDDLTTDVEYETTASQFGITIIRSPKLDIDGAAPSSTRIRRLIQGGDIMAANNLLGYDYCLTGVVQHGNGLGQKMGFPTANLLIPEFKLLPPEGVYAGWVEMPIADHNAELTQHAAPALINIGTNPTVGNNHLSVEVHIPDYQGGELYGKTLFVHLKRFIRNEQTFPSLEALRLQMLKDKKSL